MCKMVILIIGRNQTKKLCDLNFRFFKKFWPECKYPLVLATETEAPQNSIYNQVIYTEKDSIWGERVDKALQKIDADYILLSPEDFFLCDYVNDKLVEECLLKLKDENIVAIRLDLPSFFTQKYDSKYNYVPKGSPYRVIAQPMIFKKYYLEELAKQHFNPWQFEIYGSEYSDKLNGDVLVCKKKIYPYVHAWGKGCWTREAISLFKKERIDKSIYENTPVYPIVRYMIDNLWSIAIRVFPNYFINYSKKKSRNK